MVALAALAVCTALGQTAGVGRTLTPAQLAAHRVTRLTAVLDLTAAQQTSATTIFTTEFTALQPLQSSLQTAHKTLAADIEANNASAIATDAQTIGNLTQQRVEAQATADAAFYALLTAAQQTKYKALNPRGMEGPGGMRGGFGAGGPRR